MLCPAMMNNQLDPGVHEIQPEATIKLLIFSLSSLSSFCLTGTYCQRVPLWRDCGGSGGGRGVVKVLL